MDQDIMRLELLKLTYTHGRSPDEAVAGAKILEAYVTNEHEVSPPVKRGPYKKKTRDNPLT